MAKLTTSEQTRKDVESWLALINDLTREVESWAADRHWAVHREEKTVRESRLGEYVVPVLSVLAPAGRVQLDPVARHVAGGDGRIDLLAWPSLTRLLLIRTRSR